MATANTKLRTTRQDVESFFRAATGNRYWGHGGAWTEESIHISTYDLEGCPVRELKNWLRGRDIKPTDKGLLIYLSP